MPAKVPQSDGPRALSTTLAWIILGLGLYAAISTALISYRAYSPVMFWDQWITLDSYMHSGGAPPLAELWEQHNEHRIAIGRLACYLDLRLFGGRNVSLLIEIYLIQACAAVLLALMFRRFGNLRGAAMVTAIGFCIFCMLCPIQIENFIWAFQVGFVFAGFAAAVSFAAAIWHASSERYWISGPLLLSLCAAFAAEASLADGVLAWPVLIGLAYILKFSDRSRTLTLVTGIAAVGLYLRGYRSPSYIPSPWSALAHPLSIAKYVVTYFASTWDPSLPSTSPWPTVSELITILAIAFALFSAVRLIYERDLLQSFLAANLVFTLLAALVTSLGRVSFGIAQAATSRYQNMALYFWASLALLLLVLLARNSARDFAISQLQVGLIILMIAAVGRFGGFEQTAMQHKTMLDAAYAAIVRNPSDQAAAKALTPSPELLPVWRAFMISHNLGPERR